jgi:peptide deformylase
VSLPLILYPDPKLRKVCAPVAKFDDSLRKLVEGMLQVMAAKRGVGLAGPQVGVLRRIFVCNPTGEPADAQVCINPELVDLVGSAEAEEGCLCMPGVYVPVRRAERATIRAYDVEGRPFERSAEGLLARIWQHESDHLDGVLILDRTSTTAKMAVRSLLRELEKKHRPTKAASSSARAM